jgi:hypothetical protein
LSFGSDNALLTQPLNGVAKGLLWRAHVPFDCESKVLAMCGNDGGIVETLERGHSYRELISEALQDEIADEFSCRLFREDRVLSPLFHYSAIEEKWTEYGASV